VIGSRPDGSEFAPHGDQPTGMLTYGPDGRMSAIISPDVPRFASDSVAAVTPAEAVGALRRSVGYFGTFTVDAATSTASHHIEGSVFPNWVGQTHTRYLTLDGHSLTITTPPLPVPGGDVVYTLRWHRAGREDL
jgi:hypothetical protein